MFDVSRFVESCQQALHEPAPELAVKELMFEVAERPGEIVQALGEPAAGGINTLYRADDLTVLHIVWTPGMRLYPHEHRMWAVIGIYGGQEDNAFYRRSPEGLSTAGGKTLLKGDAIVLGRDAIHAVSNPRREFTQALHVYGGDFFGVPRSEWDPETMREKPFDIDNARRIFAAANEQYQADFPKAAP